MAGLLLDLHVASHANVVVGSKRIWDQCRRRRALHPLGAAHRRHLQLLRRHLARRKRQQNHREQDHRRRRV